MAGLEQGFQEAGIFVDWLQDITCTLGQHSGFLYALIWSLGLILAGKTLQHDYGPGTLIHRSLRTKPRFSPGISPYNLVCRSRGKRI